ncbi:MAG: UvrD-helicase domain-containing protein [Bernardetiaceae bacterium]|nr:UvrD-helicase domain-containing protein [Bernardetiaceae bacterium]
MTQAFKIYRSSAGSGKTFTLTKEYLKVALACPDKDGKGNFDPQYFRQILAITFTNDAAKEMKERIVDKLKNLAQAKENDDYLSLLKNEIAQSYPELPALSEQDLQYRAKRLYQTILHNYSDFSVSTIDAFNRRIVQTFAQDLGLPPRFEVELDAGELLIEGTGKLLDSISPQKEHSLRKLLREFIIKQAEDNKSWHIDRQISDFSTVLFAENEMPYIRQIEAMKTQELDAVKKAYLDKLTEIEKVLMPQLAQAATEVLALIENYGLKEKDFYQGARGIYNYFNKKCTVDNLIQTRLAPEVGKYTIDFVTAEKLASGKVKTYQKEAIEAIQPILAEAFYKIEASKAEHYTHYLVARDMRSTIYQIMTLKKMREHIRALLDERNQVFISEFNERINHIVASEPVPYIYERLGERYKHILIDEFQDTSRLQWHNLIPLLANSLATQDMSMVVGDAKQAIYSFRGGNADLLVDLPAVPSAAPDSYIAEHAEKFKQTADPITLGTNYRSRQNIIDFNNQFFEGIRDALAESYPAIENYYGETAQKFNHKTGGHVACMFIESEDSIAEAYWAQTFTLIKQLKEEQGYDYSDIAILVRRNADGAFIAEKLIEASIPVLSSESLLLSASPAINFIMQIFSLLQQPKNPKVIFEVLDFMDRHFDKIKPSPFAAHYQKRAEFCQNASLDAITQHVEEHYNKKLKFEELRFRSLYEIAEVLISEFELSKPPTRAIYLQRFLDEVFFFAKKKSNNLIDFLEYWERKKNRLSVNSPEQTDSVRVLSIHKSKGLEFPIVILPFADWSLVPRPNTSFWAEWTPNPIVPAFTPVILSYKAAWEGTALETAYRKVGLQAMIDGLNMLYVALTRPTEKLFILSKENKTPKTLADAKNVSQLLAFQIEKLAEEDAETAGLYVFAEDEQSAEAKETTHFADMIRLPSIKQNANIKDLQVQREELEEHDPEEIFRAKTILAQESLAEQSLFVMRRLTHLAQLPKLLEHLEHEGIFSQEIRKEVESHILQIKENATLASYFEKQNAARVFFTKEIYLGQGRQIRCDRLLLSPAKTSAFWYEVQTDDLRQDMKKLYIEKLREMGYPNPQGFSIDLSTMQLL